MLRVKLDVQAASLDLEGEQVITLPPGGSEQSIQRNLSFASDSRNCWYVQSMSADVKLSINGQADRHKRPCYRLKPGDEIHVVAVADLLGARFYPEGPSTESRVLGLSDFSRVLWHAVYCEKPIDASPPQLDASTASSFGLLADNEFDPRFDLCVRRLPLSAMFSLARTSRQCREGVRRTMASSDWVAAATSQRSLWQLLGEGWPSSVVVAKVHADPQAGTKIVHEMLSQGSLSRLSGFPLDHHITKGWSEVPANTLLECPTLEVLSDLLACVAKELGFRGWTGSWGHPLEWLDRILEPPYRVRGQTLRIGPPTTDWEGFHTRVELLKEATVAKLAAS